MKKPKRKKKIWENRNKIFEGIKNFIFRKQYIEKIANERINICRQNTCGFYDQYGISEMAIGNMNKESCAACGCVLQLKTRSLKSSCGLEEIDLTPLWKNK